MPRTRTVVRLFLASPSDVTEERVTTEEVVKEINQGMAPKLGIVLELMRWEDMIPGMDPEKRGGEPLILDQADIDDTDLFIGVLWNRFGTPTGRAQSGTEEEFRVAYSAWDKTGRPRIMFYFCQTPANLQTEDELEQKRRVINFRKEIAGLGLFKDYADIHAFENLLRQHIQALLLDVTVAKAESPFEKRSTRSTDIASGQFRPVIEKTLNTEGMVLIPSGTFLCGRASTETLIPYDYYIDVTPVTNKEFSRFIDETSYLLHDSDPVATYWLALIRAETLQFPDHPITRVTWYDASAYASWRGKRLPTSQEWEKAARGTDGRLFPWGNKFDPNLCNSSESGIGRTTPVLKYEQGKSPNGCYDMVGNTFEWTYNWTDRPRHSSVVNSEKINRGGSFNRKSVDLVCWYEESDPPSLRMADMGFRCVLVPGEFNHFRS